MLISKTDMGHKYRIEIVKDKDGETRYYPQFKDKTTDSWIYFYISYGVKEACVSQEAAIKCIENFIKEMKKYEKKEIEKYIYVKECE